MAVIRYIGDTTYTVKYKSVSSFDEFLDWLKIQKVISLDVETNVVKSILDRELVTAQFGSLDGSIMYVLQWSYLTPKQISLLLSFLSSTNSIILIYTTFEYTIFKKYGIELKNVWDCFTQEKVLNAGYTQEKGFYSLAGTLKRRFDMDISKAMQCEFGDNILDDQKIEYAAIDVYKLGKLYEIQKEELKIADRNIGHKIRFSKTGKKFSEVTYYKGLVKTSWWENEFCKVLGDIEFVGMQHDRQKWIENYNLSQPIVENKTKELNDLLVKSVEPEVLISNKLYTDVDILESIWTSSNKKLFILSMMFDGIKGTSKVALKEYLRGNDPSFPRGLKINGKAWENSTYKSDIRDKFGLIKMMAMRTKDNLDSIDVALNNFVLTNFRDKLIEEGLLVPADTVLINWNSPAQKVLVFKYFNPNIEDTQAETVKNNVNTHPIFSVYLDYADANALITKFGLKYLDNVDVDGRIRTRFDPILTTGRIASKQPRHNWAL